MSNNKNNTDSPFGRLVATVAVGWTLWTWPLQTLYDPVLRGLWWFGAFCFCVGTLKSLPTDGSSFGNLFKLIRAFSRDDSKGSAGWMTEKDIRRQKLHRRRKGARFAGIVNGTALWLWTEVHHLIIGPAGSAKTSAVIVNILMGSSESALITDIKGELWMITRDHRSKAYGHRVMKVDPKDPDNSIHINPLDDVAREVEADDPAALSRIRGIVFQLLPDPKGGGGSNEVFYKGARVLIVTVVLAVIIVMPPKHRNFATVYRMLSDLDLLHDLLEKASKSKALNGEIADMARTAHAMFFGDGNNAKTAESFRINALQALEAFGPGNYLARITSNSTFHFSELKTTKASVYLMIDYANSEVLGAFSGLLQHLAADAMVAEGTNKPVLFCFDEFTAAPMRKLVKVLVLLRSAGVRVVMATQDLNEIERVYSKEDLETIISETYIKQFLAVIRSKKTLEWLASYLGEITVTVSSFAMGKDGAQESLSRAARKLITEDELRRLPEDAQVILYGNNKPILAKKVQVFAISKWRRTLGINLSYGKKRKLLPVEVRFRWWGTEVTPRGMRRYRQMMREFQRPDRKWRRFLAEALPRVVPVTAIATVAAAIVLLNTAGLPNLRWEYAYRGPAREAPVSYIWCRYVGPTSPGTIGGPNCPLILWRKP